MLRAAVAATAVASLLALLPLLLQLPLPSLLPLLPLLLSLPLSPPRLPTLPLPLWLRWSVQLLPPLLPRLPLLPCSDNKPMPPPGSAARSSAVNWPALSGALIRLGPAGAPRPCSGQMNGGGR